jgi:hypothetical protein
MVNQIKKKYLAPEVISYFDDQIDATEVLISGLDGRLTTAEGDIGALESDVSGLDSRLTTAEGDISGLDGRLTTAEGEIDAIQAELPLKADLVGGLVPASQLPSYVDDVLEFDDLASFPASGESGKIYVAKDTNKTYRWSGSAYIYITSGAVDSVFGRTGVVTAQSGDYNSDQVTEGSSNLYFTDARAKSASVSNAIVDGVIDMAPSQDAVHDALALKLNTADFPAEFSSELATKSTNDLAEGGSNLYFTDARARSAAVADMIMDGVLDIAPSQNAVKDAITALENEDATMLKLDGSRPMTGTLNMGSNGIESVSSIQGLTSVSGAVSQDMTFGISSKFVFQAPIDMGAMDPFGGSKIIGVQDGSNQYDAVNKGQLDAVESGLDSRIDALEAIQWASPYKKTLSAGDISNGYIDLPALAVETNGMGVFVDRLAMHQGASEDYTLSVVGGVTRITFLNDLVNPGNQALQAGDSIFVRYQVSV